MAASALIGASFWIRQYCVAVFPALLLATVFSATREPRERVLRSAAPAFWSMLVFIGTVAAYYWWAASSGNLPIATVSRAGNLVGFSPVALFMMSLCALAYLSFFFMPVLAGVKWKQVACRPRTAAGLLTAGLLTAIFCARYGAPERIFAAPVHRVFPYLKNILHNAGVGPLTTTDLYVQHIGDYPHWDTAVWAGIEILIIAAHSLWAALPGPAALTPRQREIFDFGVAFSVVSLALFVQVSQLDVFDRYFFALLLGGTISLACLMTGAAVGWWRGAIVLSAMALFTIGGVHDYFAWNRGRWDLVAAARSRGIARPDINGGWEVNGWFRFEYPEEQPHLPVLHECAYGPICLNDAFVIGVTLPEGYTEIDKRRPVYWLAHGPEVLLCRRNDVPAGRFQKPRQVAIRNK